MSLDGWRDDHRVALEHLERLRAGSDLAAFADLARLLTTHFEREERDLMPALASFLPADTGPLPVLREEHGLLRDLLEKLGRRIDDEGLTRLETLLRGHIQKEEELLYPFAESHLDPATLAGFAGDENAGGQGRP